MQSAYRTGHSVETALVRVQNDLLRALDDHQEAVLILLDLTAAFDTIDHGIMLNRLSSRYGITGTALAWFESYLNGRTQSVIINNVSSDPVTLDCGTPQGSVAGPIKFILYSAPIEDVVSLHDIHSVLYADDTQLYVMFKPDDRTDSITKIQNCVADIKAWAVKNKLVINDDKTEVLHLTSRFMKSHLLPSVQIGDASIAPKNEVRNLGAVLDSQLLMKSHVNNICRSAMCAIRKIAKIRQYLSQEATERLVHAFVSSRLDNCNSLLYGLPDRDINKIQRIQNIAARLVTLTKRNNHITPILHQLHWLPIRKRVSYKILLLVFKALHNLGPRYLSELLTRYTPTRALRSQNLFKLNVPRVLSTFYGARAFSVAGPTLWNELPLSLKTKDTVNAFKAALKTYLF